MAKRDEGCRQPREPVELRKELKLRRAATAKPSSEMGEARSVPAFAASSGAHPARRGAAGPEAGTIAQTEHDRPDAGAVTLAKSTNVRDLTASAADPLEGLLPNATSKAARPVAYIESRGPDYTTLVMVITGLAGQSERYRRQWRERNDKDLGTPPIVASQKTHRLYEGCGLRLLTQYVRSMTPGTPFEAVDPRDFADWLLASKPLWDDSTWRFHRAGAIVAMQTIPSEHMKEALAWLYSDLHTRTEMKAHDDDSLPDRRANRVDWVHFEKLKFALRALDSNVARWLETWLDASIHTGLAPAQWPLSSLEMQPDTKSPHGRRIWLHVVMGHVQAGWLTHRTIDISTFSGSTVEAVRQMIDNAHGWAREGKFSARQGEAARLLRETSKLLFPRMQLRYDLHSPRQQFIENMRSIYNDEEVAALVGQLCLNKERKNYGKHRAAWTTIDQVPLPSPQLVKRMERRLKIYETLRELKELKDNRRRVKAERRGNPSAE